MKTKTLFLFSKHMNDGDIYFPDEGPNCEIRLTNGQIRDIIASEYGIRPKRIRIVQKKLKQLISDLLSIIVKDIKENGYQAQSQRSE